MSVDSRQIWTFIQGVHRTYATPFAVSPWIDQGFAFKEVMTFAGHASVQMTMERYGHLFPTPDHQHAMAQVEQRVFG